MTIDNLTPQVATLTNTSLDYGIIKQGAETNITLELISEEELVHISIGASCGCTLPTVTPLSNSKIEMKIYYNSSLLGYFNKVITWVFTEKGENKQIQINITGTVTQ